MNQEYRSQLNCLCPVAVKLGRHEVHAPDQSTWRDLTCDACGEKFAIGPDHIHGSRLTEEQCVEKLKVMLGKDHQGWRTHDNYYKIPDTP